MFIFFSSCELVDTALLFVSPPIQPAISLFCIVPVFAFFARLHLSTLCSAPVFRLFFVFFIIIVTVCFVALMDGEKGVYEQLCPARTRKKKENEHNYSKRVKLRPPRGLSFNFGLALVNCSLPIFAKSKSQSCLDVALWVSQKT